MSKFRIGDKVMFKADANLGVLYLEDETLIDLYAPQKIADTSVAGHEVKIEGDDEWWSASFWEPFEEWSKHQKPVSGVGKPDSELLRVFAQALVDNENPQRCDFCETGYCYSNHKHDCVILQAKKLLEEPE